MKSNDLQGHLECYIYWVNWDHTAPQAYFSLPLSPQVYRAIALLFNPFSSLITAMYLVSSLHVGPYPSWASDTPWGEWKCRSLRNLQGGETKIGCATFCASWHQQMFAGRMSSVWHVCLTDWRGRNMRMMCNERDMPRKRAKGNKREKRERERERDVDEFLCTAYLMSLELPFFREFKWPCNLKKLPDVLHQIESFSPFVSIC